MGKKSIIVAMAKNGCIGKNNNLPWRLPADLKFFKKTTLGHPILMGRKTFESIGSKPLPGRKNIVITTQKDFTAEGVEVFHNLEDAFQATFEDLFIIGGANIYSQTLQQADYLYITKVHTDVDGDAYFPKINIQDWKLIQEETYLADEKNQFDMTFQLFERV